MVEIKIKTYKIQKKGLRGLTIGIPKAWFDDQGLNTGDKIDIYRDEKDRLILVVNKKESSHEHTVSNSARGG